MRSSSTTGKGLRFTEYNAETPAGAAYNDALTEVFEGMPVMREFQRTHHLRPLPARSGVLHALLDAYEQWSRQRARSRASRFSTGARCRRTASSCSSSDYFASQGLECRIVDPREVEYADGKLRAGDFEISLIYKRVLHPRAGGARAASTSR